ncbi:hypothetical protein HanPSC8_Chr10g0431141 [Helianthus annuus]|nr:hypothetical protein HanPSC8_Chr10g0431141 [Helianthus annuus]
MPPRFPTGVGSPETTAPAFFILFPMDLVVEKVTRTFPFEARSLPSLRRGLTWPCAGNVTKSTCTRSSLIAIDGWF